MVFENNFSYRPSDELNNCHSLHIFLNNPSNNPTACRDRRCDSHCRRHKLRWEILSDFHMDMRDRTNVDIPRCTCLTHWILRVQNVDVPLAGLECWLCEDLRNKSNLSGLQAPRARQCIPWCCGRCLRLLLLISWGSSSGYLAVTRSGEGQLLADPVEDCGLNMTQ